MRLLVPGLLALALASSAGGQSLARPGHPPAMLVFGLQPLGGKAVDAAACSAARTASENFTLAQINVPPGAAVESNRPAANQIMSAVQQYSAYLDQVTRATCR